MPLRMLRRGHTIVSVSYRLSCTGQLSSSGMLEDVRDAVSFVKDHGHEWGVDTSAGVILLGTSAGGNLALNAAFQTPVLRDIIGVIAHYAPTELRPQVLADRGALLASPFARFHAVAFMEATQHVCSAAVDSKHREECFNAMSPMYHLEKAANNVDCV